MVYLRRHRAELAADVFHPAFLVVAIISAVSAWLFWQMPDDAGHEISEPQGGRRDVQPARVRRRPASKAASGGAPRTRGISGWGDHHCEERSDEANPALLR